MPNASVFRSLCEDLMMRGQSVEFDLLKENLKKHVNSEEIPSDQKQEQLENWTRDLLDWHFLERYLVQEVWEEIALHGPGCGQITTHDGVQPIEFGPLDKKDYQLMLEILCYRNGIAWHQGQAFASFGLSIGGIPLRATLLHQSTMPMQCSKLFLRRPTPVTRNLKELLKNDVVSRLLIEMVQHKKNVVISGPTGCGKTTLLKAMLKHVPENEHVVTVEDTQELERISKFNTGLVSFGDDKQMSDFLAWSMRISPKRIILGEIRSREIVPYFLALNTGHRGLLATVHANSAEEVPQRLALLFGLYQSNAGTPWESIMKLLCKSINYVIFMNNKSIVQIIAINGSDGDTVYFEDVLANALTPDG